MASRINLRNVDLEKEFKEVEEEEAEGMR